ncbi:unnamed protein product [Ixodes pacificus]
MRPLMYAAYAQRLCPLTGSLPTATTSTAISRENHNIETENRRRLRSGEGAGQCLRNIPVSYNQKKKCSRG